MLYCDNLRQALDLLNNSSAERPGVRGRAIKYNIVVDNTPVSVFGNWSRYGRLYAGPNLAAHQQYTARFFSATMLDKHNEESHPSYG